ncbi:MAG: hypothetical protein HY566_01210, partial [Candidatus Kerfeldbacteria bacterium]|nr:hypothetical protein [Candidatus Kerfeldbacteria bacterium]
MKSLLRKLLPQGLLLRYHRFVALLAAVRYGEPSRKLVVIGITGTKGKTSAANFLWSALTASGFTAGLISTANIRIGNREEMNRWHMTMPGRFVIQSLLARMVKAGCDIAIVETTSEGLKQWRHAGIAYDIAVFTNLTPEHLPSHGGSFEAYKQAKGKMFAALKGSVHKQLRGRPVAKTIIANHDSDHAAYFLSFWAEKKLTFGMHDGANLRATDVRDSKNGVTFSAASEAYTLRIPGAFNVMNALPAILAAKVCGATRETIQKGFDALTMIPGRMERIDERQPFAVYVDYAHEKQSITAVLSTGRAMVGPGRKVIILLGAEGGGRDPRKRPIMGDIAARIADITVVSNVDPYSDDPTEIAEDIARAAEASGAKRGEQLFV